MNGLPKVHFGRVSKPKMRLLTVGNACRCAVLLGMLALASRAPAQDCTVRFNISDPGVSKAVPTWRLDTAWLNADKVHYGVIFIGQPQVDVIRFSFTGAWPSFAPLATGAR